MALAMEERVPHRSHPAMRVYDPADDWKLGCAGGMCFDLTFALEVFFCAPCSAGYLEKNLTGDGDPGMESTPCCALVASCYLCPFTFPFVCGAMSYQIRQSAIRRYNLKGPKNSCCDQMIGWCCCPCSFCQVKNEIEMRKEYNGSLCTDPSPNYTVEMWNKSKLGPGNNAALIPPVVIGVAAPAPANYAINLSYGTRAAIQQQQNFNHQVYPPAQPVYAFTAAHPLYPGLAAAPPPPSPLPPPNQPYNYAYPVTTGIPVGRM